MRLTKQVTFEGRVQGVGFRYTTKELAKGFEVTGWVKNLPEGTVEMLVCGEQDEVNEFIQEIVQESDVAHHIKNTREETLVNPTVQPLGFVIQ